MKTSHIYIILSFLIIAAALLNLGIGSVHIPAIDVFKILFGSDVENQTWEIIVKQSRLPQCVTAILCGAALSVSGLMLQTLFNNPLAGPSILGITTGASLGVAIVTLLGGGLVVANADKLSGWLAVLAGAIIGAFVVMFIILLLSSVIKSNIMLLIAGIMIGYLASSLITLLNFFATAEGVHSYTIWGMGNFGGVPLSQMPLFIIIVLFGLALSVMLIKPLNALLLGENYAENLGVNIKLVRGLLLFATGLLSAIVTAFCGPISFIGLAVPHIARMLTRTSNHTKLVPTTILIGSFIALMCNFVCHLPDKFGILPLNAVTPIFGAPIIIYIIINQRKMRYFN